MLFRVKKKPYSKCSLNLLLPKKWCGKSQIFKGFFLQSSVLWLCSFLQRKGNTVISYYSQAREKSLFASYLCCLIVKKSYLKCCLFIAMEKVV